MPKKRIILGYLKNVDYKTDLNKDEDVIKPVIEKNIKDTPKKRFMLGYLKRNMYVCSPK